MHLRYIKQINDAVAGKPAGMAITTHLCRGSFPVLLGGVRPV